MEKEVWLPIKGYEGIYEISNLGNVKRLKREVFNGYGYMILHEKILKNSSDGKGYLKISLTKNLTQKTKKIHQLVAISFLNHKPNGINIVVDHIDNNKLNNNVNNLQLITSRLNSSKDKKNYTSKYTGVFWCKNNHKWVSRIYINGKRKYLGSYKNEIEASNSYQKALKDISHE